MEIFSFDTPRIMLWISSAAIVLLFCALISPVLQKLGKSNRIVLLLPPGPRPIPILGCLIQMLRNKPTFRWIHQVMEKLNTEIACIRLGGTHVFCIKSPEIAREILRKQDAVFASRPHCMTGELASSGYKTAVISPAGPQWKKMRKVITHELLSPETHSLLHDKRSEEADHLVGYVFNQAQQKDGLVNLRIATRHYCGNLVRRLVLGKRFLGKGRDDGGPGVEEEEQVAGLFTILQYLYGFSIADYVSWLNPFDFDGYRKIIKGAIQDVRKYQDPVIEERLQMWKNGMKRDVDDFLDVLINLRDSNNGPLLTPDEIKAEIVEIMLAAVDNPSNAVEWTMAEMINQPAILRRAQKELEEVVGQDGWVQESHIKKLNYVKACAKEAFRLHPVAPFNVPHVSMSDTTISGYFIPKGSHVLLSRQGLGQNPRVWNEPLSYKPERHIHSDGSEVVLLDQELRLISFSTGRRGCPALILGTVTTIMLLARLIQGFDWSAPNGDQRVDLLESENDMFLAKPLHALAKPRLNAKAYNQLQN